MSNHKSNIGLIIVTFILILMLPVFASGCTTKSIKELQSQYNSLQAAITSVQSTLSSHAKLIADLQKNTSINPDTITKLQSDYTALVSAFNLLQLDVTNLKSIDASSLATKAELSTLLANLTASATELARIGDEIITLNSTDNSIQADLAAALATINTDHAAIIAIQDTLNENTNVEPHVSLDSFRSSGISLTVNGEGQFAIVVTLYGTDLMVGKVTSDDANIDAEYLYGQGIKQTISDDYPLIPDHVETEPGGADSHTHDIDLSGIVVYPPAYVLSGKGTQLVLFIMPDGPGWADGDSFQIKFNGLVVNHATCIIGWYR